MVLPDGPSGSVRGADSASAPGSSGSEIRGGLVAACLRGDQTAWETLVRQHAALVYTVIRRCGYREDEAADLYQDVWVAAWDNLRMLRDEGGLAAWLVTIAARKARRGWRGRAAFSTGSADEALERPDPDPPPDEVVIGRERRSAVRSAISSLSERDRRVVEYFFYDASGPSYAEIADRLGVSPDTVGPLRSRCLRRLRAALAGAPELADEPDRPEFGIG